MINSKILHNYSILFFKCILRASALSCCCCYRLVWCAEPGTQPSALWGIHPLDWGLTGRTHTESSTWLCWSWDCGWGCGCGWSGMSFTLAAAKLNLEMGRGLGGVLLLLLAVRFMLQLYNIDISCMLCLSRFMLCGPFEAGAWNLIAVYGKNRNWNRIFDLCFNLNGLMQFQLAGKAHKMTDRQNLPF